LDFIACLGLVSGLFVEVYFGHTATHLFKVAGGASEHSTRHTALTVAGFFVCVLVMVYVTRLTRQALAGIVPE
jgi:preprotein translocase subunit SecG